MKITKFGPADVSCYLSFGLVVYTGFNGDNRELPQQPICTRAGDVCACTPHTRPRILPKDHPKMTKHAAVDLFTSFWDFYRAVKSPTVWNPSNPGQRRNVPWNPRGWIIRTRFFCRGNATNKKNICAWCVRNPRRKSRQAGAVEETAHCDKNLYYLSD